MNIFVLNIFINTVSGLNKHQKLHYQIIAFVYRSVFVSTYNHSVRQIYTISLPQGNFLIAYVINSTFRPDSLEKWCQAVKIWGRVLQYILFNIKMGALWKKIVKKMFCSVYIDGVYEV